MTNPKVSVIVTTYNRAHMVTETIDSILDQTFKDFELIVVDNYSADNTEEVVKSYTDERIRYFKHQNNGIIAVNRNYGINQAQSEYIAFCDDDDLWYPEKLEKCLEIFRQNKDIILVCHDENVSYNGKIIRVDICGTYVEPVYYDLLFSGNRIFTSAVVVRRDTLLRADGFNENPGFFGVEDWDLWMRLATVGKFYFLHEILGQYRIHGSAYSYDVEKRTRHSLNVVEHHFKHLPTDERRKHERKIKKVKAAILFGGGWGNLRRGEFFRAQNWFKEGIQVYPFSFRNYIGLTLALFRICPPQGMVKAVKAITGK